MFRFLLSLFLIISNLNLTFAGFNESSSIDSIDSENEEDVQNILRNNKNNWKMDVPVANVLPVHPAGIFYSRIRPNYRTEPLKAPLIRLNLSSSNSWLQPVTGYRPLSESKRRELAKLEWYKRQSAFDREKDEAKTIYFQADAVIRSLMLSIAFPLKENQELNVHFKGHFITGGKFPLTFLTSDDFIEWFHSNIAGGEDVFGRKFFEYNKAFVLFRDEENRQFQYEKGDVFFPGFQFDYSFLLPLLETKKQKIDLRLTPMVGINLAKPVNGFDAGFTGTGVYKNKLSEKFSMHTGISLMFWAPGVISKENQVSIINKEFIPGIEGFLAFNLHKKNGKARTLGMSYSIRDSYRKRSDYDSMVLYGEWQTSAQWHHSIGHWYKTRIKMNYFFTFSGKTKFTLYLQEDYPPNNAPDLQTGVEWVIPLNLILNPK